jgi:hypothetical protein
MARRKKYRGSGGLSMPGSGGRGGGNSGGTKPHRHGTRNTATGGTEASMQHLASKLAKARTRKQVSGIYRKALR